MHNVLGVQIDKSAGCLCSHESDHVLAEGPQLVEVEAKVAAQHQVNDAVQVEVVLEGIAQIAREVVLDLLEKLALLDRVVDSLHRDDLLLVHVLERIDFLGALVLHDANLCEQPKTSIRTRVPR